MTKRERRDRACNAAPFKNTAPPARKEQVNGR